jgi:MFS family permease
MVDQVELTRGTLRTPRAAALAGIVFSVLLATALILVTLSSPANPTSEGSWMSESARRTAVTIALNLVPFAGIAFLWFIGVVRDRVGHREDRFFSSVFLGSGLLFVAMLFAAAAVAGGAVAAGALEPTGQSPTPVVALGRQVTGLLLQVYAMRMASVFMISTATITLTTQVAPRWIGLLGYVIAAVLLVSVGLTPWVELLFPAWILLLSIDILRTGLRRPTELSGPSGTAAG